MNDTTISPAASASLGPGRSRVSSVGLIAAPVIAVAVYMLLGGSDLSHPARATAAVGTLMALWWATEALPLEVTALAPLLLFPTLGVAKVQAAAAPYANEIIFLFLGGMLIGAALERWSLHRRFALGVLRLVGPRPRMLVLGFAAGAGFVSMWVSNTAATVMMLPVATSVITMIGRHVHADVARSFGVAAVLGVAYGASIGGVGTLIGTPPTAQLAAFTSGLEHPITFVSWLPVGLTVAVTGVLVCWLVLTRVALKVPNQRIHAVADLLTEERRVLGPWTAPQRRTLIVFVAAAVAWVAIPLLRRTGLADEAWFAPLRAATDSVIAVAAALLLFIIPAGREADGVARPRALLTWGEGEKIHWGVLLLFGGGLSLADAIVSTGLDKAIADQAAALDQLPLLVVLIIITAAACLLTEVMSNTALVALALPIGAALAVRLDVPPAVVLVPVTLGASLAFMLPAGTPPNAIVFASGTVRIGDMIRAGAWLNIIFSIMTPLLVYALYRLGWLPGM